jgi:hypothetical protein
MLGRRCLYEETACFSNLGAPVDILTPAVDMTSARNDEQTNILSGTYMATPRVYSVALPAFSAVMHDGSL